jgi:hypothetical protein
MGVFSSDVLRPPRENELEVTVFGPGYGESIVLHVPAVGWGVVDCCRVRIGSEIVVPPLAYLLELLSPPYPELAFIALTHPHEDHYRGFDELLRRYPGGTARVCRYSGDGIRELKTYIAHQRQGQRQVLAGLPEVFRAMDAAVADGARIRRLGEMTGVFDCQAEIPHHGPATVRMTALSPSAMSVRQYVETLFASIPRPGEPVKPLNDDFHNLVSVAMLLVFGDLQVVLGSDVERGSGGETGWSAVISNSDCPDVWANLVKVPHHGSAGAFSEEAWTRHAARMKPLAVVTPFSKSLLPTPTAVSTLCGVAEMVGVTSKISAGQDLTSLYRRDVAESIRGHVRSIRILEKPSKLGFVRIRLLADGTVTERHAEPPAHWTSAA